MELPDGTANDRIVLAREAAIRLGALSIEPALRRVAHDNGREEIVEPRVMQVLVALIQAGGRILTRDDLLMSCWHGIVVGEDAIDRVIGRLRRLADGVGGGAFKVETITKVGYRLVSIGPRPGIELIAAGPDAVPPTPRTATAAATEPLLAVLAFDNLCDGDDMTWFSDGVSEEILQTVAHGAELKVIGRGSSFQFRGADKAASHVARVLKATHVLDGSVRRSGTTLRIAANLIECAGETTLWSDRFDRELSDVFAIQDEIAAAIAAALRVAFAPTVMAESIDPAAYNLYLRALEIRNRGLEPAIRLSVTKLLDAATELAPMFARAWVFLATMLAERLRFDKSDQSHEVTRADVDTAARTALRLDPSLGGAYQALGQLEAFGRFAEREALHDKALSVAPNDPTVLTSASLFLAELGRVQEALDLAGQAYGLDPIYPWVANWYANMLGYAGRSEDANAMFANLCALWPDNELISWNAAASAMAWGDWPRFDTLVAAARERGFDGPSLRRVIATGSEQRDPGPMVRARSLKKARDKLARSASLPLTTLLWLYRLDMKDEVFDLIDQASFAYMFNPELRSPNLASNGVIFGIAYNGGMMRDVRFVGLCAKLGLCDYWVTTGHWPDCAEAVAHYYDFKAEVRRLASGV